MKNTIYKRKMIAKLSFINIKNFCSYKYTGRGMKRLATEREKNISTSDKGLDLGIYTGFLEVNIGKKEPNLKKWAKAFITEDIRVITKHTKRCMSS